MFAPKKLDLTQSAKSSEADVDTEVRALIDDLDQFFDEPMAEVPLLLETQEIEPPEPELLVADDGGPVSLEAAVLEYLSRSTQS